MENGSMDHPPLIAPMRPCMGFRTPPQAPLGINFQPDFAPEAEASRYRTGPHCDVGWLLPVAMGGDKSLSRFQ